MNILSTAMTVATPDEELSKEASSGEYRQCDPLLKMIIPTGRMQQQVLKLLSEIGINIQGSRRSYRPLSSESFVTTKMLKPQNIPNLVSLGRHDCGFAGYDWIIEQDSDAVELLDLGFDPVRIVAAVPQSLAANGTFDPGQFDRPMVIASEYKRLTKNYVESRNLKAVFLQTFGATEALPPEDADMIVDNTATGTTLRENKLEITDELMTSTTRFICNKEALENREKRLMLEQLTMLMRSTLMARSKVVLEMNVFKKDFERIVAQLPCMRAPTVSQLYNEDGYAVKVAVSAKDVYTLIPKLVSLGARDILEYKVEKIVV
jgi:ATP phosphoribosyltransferase